MLRKMADKMKEDNKAAIVAWDKWVSMREEKFSDAILKKKYSKGLYF